MHKEHDEIKVRYAYIIKIDNRGNKSKFFGHKVIYYVGQTNNLVRRFKEHLKGINSKFLNENFRDARKTLVHVEYVFGTEYESIQREWGIKKLSKAQKDKLIKSEENVLIEYIPLKMIILKHIYDKEKKFYLPFDKKGYEGY